MNPRRRLWLKNKAKDDVSTVTPTHEETTPIEEVIHAATEEARQAATQHVTVEKADDRPANTKKSIQKISTRKKTTSKKK
tara:strand:- start:681 stop:920 length:240 start_codon:yes stop_codon:yes gene_type:complete